MKVIANGFPKCGNHALVKALELLGIPADVNHLSFAEGIPAGARHILIVRDPRNVVLRWRHTIRGCLNPKLSWCATKI